MASSKQHKQVKVIARYTNKQTGTVSYLVESSDGLSQYCTTLIDGKASGCSCPARSSCYHKTQLEAKEAERAEKWTAYRVELAKKLANQYMTSQVVEQIAEQLATPKTRKVAKVIKQAVEAMVPTPKRDMMTAALTTNQGYRLLR